MLSLEIYNITEIQNIILDYKTDMDFIIDEDDDPIPQYDHVALYGEPEDISDVVNTIVLIEYQGREEERRANGYYEPGGMNEKLQLAHIRRQKYYLQQEVRLQGGIVKYGERTNIITVKHKIECTHCLRTYTEKGWKNHIKTKKHQKNMRRLRGG